MLADVATIDLEIDMPSEWTFWIVDQVILIRILVEEQFRVVHLSCEDKIIELDALVNLPVLLTVNF